MNDNKTNINWYSGHMAKNKEGGRLWVNIEIHIVVRLMNLT